MIIKHHLIIQIILIGLIKSFWLVKLQLVIVLKNLAFTHPDYISLGANFIELEFTPNRVPGGSADPLLDYNIVVDRTKTLDYEFDSGVAGKYYY